MWSHRCNEHLDHGSWSRSKLSIDKESNKSFSEYVDGELLSYGSKSWANQILRQGIQECKNRDRDRASRLQLIAYYLRVLQENGFWWQYERLRNQVYLGYKKGLFTVPAGTDPPTRREEEASF